MAPVVAGSSPVGHSMSDSKTLQILYLAVTIGGPNEYEEIGERTGWAVIRFSVDRLDDGSVAVATLEYRPVGRSWFMSSDVNEERLFAAGGTSLDEDELPPFPPGTPTEWSTEDALLYFGDPRGAAPELWSRPPDGPIPLTRALNEMITEFGSDIEFAATVHFGTTNPRA